ncbi:glycoside hydrolase family 3 protein [Flectobacillus major]|uniref:glycoside hydrolase family 3 protein n=1 Tax=Flectobacillus major TaxID=103 RepID=UPI0004278D07|nr:glycoside hydrolase family 3 N-terminal domain-containing protein [Flectobacillus major]
MKYTNTILLTLFLSCSLKGQSQKYTIEQKGSLAFIQNKGGQKIGYSNTSGIKILTANGWAFKDLNKNGKLDKYEDWRLPIDERAKDLASKMSIEQIAGLMLYSAHQSIPARAGGYFAGTYKGKPFKDGDVNPEELTDQQMQFLEKDNLRHVLVTVVKSPEVAAKWNNNLQAFVEGIGLGVPANNSSDPRHGTLASAEYNAAAGGTISMWPGSLGLAATFDPAIVQKFGEVAAAEYRALGITTALSPQVDIATEPRWSRVSGTFGENPYLASAMAQAYIDGFQTSLGKKEIANGWGFGSVNAMVKHWPGGGSGEGGRDAHYANGKFAVYPGNNFAQHFIPFTEGAFKLKGKTKMASAVMPYYTISWNQDTKNKENVGNSYNKYIINDLLREKYQFDGVACTDWSITHEHKVMDSFLDGKPWGLEKLNEGELHYKALMAGVDQFGGNNAAGPIIEAYTMGVKEHGEAWMRARMEKSAVRLLRNIFRVGVFENPYLDIEDTRQTVGKPEFMQAGYEAQLKSIVLLKNKGNVLPLQQGKTVYVPKRYTPKSRNFLGIETPESLEYPVNMNIVKKYFKVTDNPEEADYALVFVNNPSTGIGYSKDDVAAGGNGYVPISLQYGEYKATEAREVSIAGGDVLENFTNRSYKNKSIKASNITDLSMILETKEKMKGKPVIVSVSMDNPMIFNEFEKQVEGILVNFKVQDQAIFELLAGQKEPSALLPLQMPANMSTVEKQAEDVPHDMLAHKDSEGNVYDFGFGLNWKGVIKDARTTLFKK